MVPILVSINQMLFRILHNHIIIINYKMKQMSTMIIGERVNVKLYVANKYSIFYGINPISYLGIIEINENVKSIFISSWS